MKFMRRFLTMFILLAVLAFAASPFVVPLLLEDKLRSEFSRATGGELAWGWALFNPFSLSVTVRNLEVKDTRGDRLFLMQAVDFDFDWSEVWSGSGTIDSQTLNATWETSGNQTLITVDHISLPDFQGMLKLGDLTLKSGSALGSVRLDTSDNIVVEGNFEISDLWVLAPPTLPSVQVPYVRLDGIAYDGNRDQLSINRVALHDPKIEIVRADHTEALEPVRDNMAGEEPLKLLVQEVHLEGGEVTFTDVKRASEPVIFSAVSGSVSKLTVGDEFGAAFDLKASVAEESPLEMVGQFSQSDVLNGAIKLRLDTLSHQHLAPYMFHLLGRGTDAGTAYMDIDIAVADDVLEGTLSLLFDQWKWGAKNPDFDGDPAPVRKAFSLLQGSGGRVRMTIPVEGNLADPTFNLDSVVRRATRRAIGDIVGAPFKLLGSLIPGGKSDLSLDKIEFAPSSADPTPLDRSKLNALAAAMNLRPELKLRIDGVAIAGIDQPEPASDPQHAVVEEDWLLNLANRRAQAVQKLLVAGGVNESRLSIVLLPLAETQKRKKPVVRLEIND